MNKEQAEKVIGGLSEPGKMPGPSYGLPAGAACPVGKLLRQVPGSRCSICYALKGRYRGEGAQVAQARRLAAVRRALKSPTSRERYVKAFVRALAGTRWFRWHDSGEVQGIAHLDLIVEICRRTPLVRHWLPTGERLLLVQTRLWEMPTNLTIRFSAPMIDAPAQWNGPASFVLSPGAAVPRGAKVCPARHNENRCGDCRLCWNPSVKLIAYPKH